MEPLKTEREYFARSLEEWLKLYLNKFALIKGEELIGTFDTDMSAVAEGARLFGNAPFLVRRIVPGDQVLNAPAYTLGILRANSAFAISGYTDSNS